MKSLFLAFAFIFIALVWLSCKKGNSPSPTILGTWSIVSDSTYNALVSTPVASKYIGVAGDHFTFKSNNTIYIQEGNIRVDTGTYAATKDSLTYNLHPYITNNVMVLQYPANRFAITALDSHNLKLKAIVYGPADGGFEEFITLKR